MREAILQAARHFLSTDPKLSKDISLVPDYSIESHARDHEQYLDVSRTRKRRAKALLGNVYIIIYLQVVFHENILQMYVILYGNNNVCNNTNYCNIQYFIRNIY